MFRDSYRRTRARRISFILVCIVVCLILSIYSVTIGPYPMTMGDVIDVLWNFITMQLQDDTTIAHIVLNLRLPRIIGGIICGFALAVCGAAMQSMMKNPLADPYTMGISSGAFLGATLSIVFGFSIIPWFDGVSSTVVNSFIFSLIPTSIIILFGGMLADKIGYGKCVTTGIAVMFLFSSITQIIMVTAPSESLADAYEWRVGSLSSIRWECLPIMAGTAIVIMTALWFLLSTAWLDAPHCRGTSRPAQSQCAAPSASDPP